MSYKCPFNSKNIDIPKKEDITKLKKLCVCVRFTYLSVYNKFIYVNPKLKYIFHFAYRQTIKMAGEHKFR